MDLSNFKKVRDALETAHFKHPDGHEITIHKNNLSPDMQKHLKALPLHMDDGGQVPDNPSPFALSAEERAKVADYVAPQQAPAYVSPKEQEEAERRGPLMEQFRKAQPNNPTVPGNVKTVSTDQPVQGQQDPGSYDPYGFNASSQLQAQGFDQQLKGITGAATAEGNAGYAQAAAAKEHIAQQQDMQAKYQKNFQDIDGEIKGTIADMQKGHIDPDRFFANKSGWQKAGVLIGLALGGNPNMIKDAIERDINAQKADMQNKNNVLAAQFHRMGNMRDAIDMTRMIQAGVYADKLQMAAATAQGPLAKARAQSAVGQLFQQYAPLAQQMAMRRSMMNGLQQGQQPDPGMMIQTMIQDPHEKQKALDALGKVEAVESLRRNVESAATALKKKPLAGMFTPGDRNTHINTFGGILGKVAEGRFNLEESKQQMQALLPSPGDSSNTLKDKTLHRQQFFDSLRAEHEAALRSRGINIPRARISFDEGSPVK